MFYYCLVSNDTALNTTTPDKLAPCHRDCVDTSVKASSTAKNTTAIRTLWVFITKTILRSQDPTLFVLAAEAWWVSTEHQVFRDILILISSFWNKLVGCWIFPYFYGSIVLGVELWPNFSHVWNLLVAGLDSTSPWNPVAHTRSSAVAYNLKEHKRTTYSKIVSRTFVNINHRTRYLLLTM